MIFQTVFEWFSGLSHLQVLGLGIILGTTVITALEIIFGDYL